MTETLSALSFHARAGLNPAVMQLERRTIASFDGTPIGVQTAGPEDAPALLLANGLGATVVAYRHLLRHFGSVFRFVSWDYRGLHSSGRPVGGYDALNVEHHAKDALAVADALGLDAWHALGWSMGVQVVLELYRHAPDRILTLVLHNGVAGRPWNTLGGFQNGLSVAALCDPALALGQRVDFLLERAIQRIVDWDGFIPLATRVGLVSERLDRDVFFEVAQGFKDLDVHVLLEILRRLGKHDAHDVLARIACPTLIVQGKRDVLTPVAAAEKMAKAIPGAQLVILPEGTHYAAVEMPDEINRHLEAFWRVAGVEVST